MLGDLAESSTSRAAYLRNLISVVPRVVWSQIRRRVTVVGMLFHAAITAAFLAAFLSKSSVAGEPTVLLRAAVPWAIWVIGRALAAAYGPRDERRQSNRALLIATVLATIGAAGLTSLPVTRVAMAIGAVFGTFLLLTRPWIPQPQPLTLNTLADHARLFQNRIWWRNIVESTVGVVVLIANVREAWSAQSGILRAGHVLLSVGVIFVIAFLQLRANSRRVPSEGALITLLRFHRGEIARQRDILRLVPAWYLFPFVPGMLVMAASRWRISAVAVVGGLLFVFGVFFMIWRLNVKAATLLDGELQKVDALEGQL